MTRKEAIQKLANYSKALRNENEYTHKSVCDVIDIVVNTEPKWISVEDMLPECLNKVLMLNANGTIKVGLHNGEYWTAEDGCSFWATHWMPLPEPPIDLYHLANPD